MGERRAAEVVQCYVHDGTGTLRRPDQELRGFAKVELDPADSAEVSIALDERAFAAWDPSTRAWTVHPGTHEIRLGASSRDLRAVLPVEVVASSAGPD